MGACIRSGGLLGSAHTTVHLSPQLCLHDSTLSSLSSLQSLSHVRLLRPHRLQPARLLCPQNSPGKITGLGCHFLLQGIFPTQELNPGLLHCRQILYQLDYEGTSASNQSEWEYFYHKSQKCYKSGVVPLVELSVKHFLACQWEKAMAPHSSTLAWKIPWMEELVGCSPWGC